MNDYGLLLLTEATLADHEREWSRLALQREALATQTPRLRWHSGRTWGVQLPVPVLRLVNRSA